MQQENQNKGVVKVREGFYILGGAQAMVSITGKQIDTVYGAQELNKGGIKIAPWGTLNLRPQEMLKLVYGNSLKPQLIYTTRDFLLGSGLGVFQKVIATEKGKPVERMEPVINNQIEDFLEMVEAEKYMRRAAYNYEFFFNVFSTISLDRQKKVEDIQCWDCTDVRAAAIDPKVGRIEKYVLHPDWANFKLSEATIIPAYDKRNPAKYAETMYHGRDYTPGQSYYDAPPWWGSETWTKVSNLIPEYHVNGMLNGYSIRWHIEIPLDYFKQYGDEKAQMAAEDALLEQMNKWLTGVKNAGKAFISKFATDPNGKPIPGFKITPIEDKMNTEAYIKLDEHANKNHASSHGLDPSLAAIDTGGKFGGSGSEKRISYQLHIALRTPNKRQILLEPFNKVIKKIEGWPRELYVGFKDVDIVTLAEDPTGKQPLTQQTSTKEAA